MARLTSMDQWIRTSSECHEVCLKLIEHCLQMGGPHAEPQHVRLLLDCAQICRTSADFMLRGSDLHPLTCGACAEVCERCAADCDRLSDDSRMADCRDSCRRCAQTCREMAA